MKKRILLLITAFIIGGFAIAQSLSLSWEGESIQHEDTIYVYGELTEDIFYEVVSHAMVTNNTDRTLQVKAMRTEIDIVEGTTNMLCWGLCFAPDTDVSPDPIAIEAGATTEDWVFAGHYQPNSKNGTSIIKYTFFNADNEDDHVSMIVYYVISPASVDDLQKRIAFGNAYPNPARNQVSFDYDFPSEITTANLQVYNMLGKQVLDFPINPNMTNVTIPVQDLGEGLYFYSLVIDGKTTSTRKLVIQR